jgi:hypothetical protein
VRLLRRGRIRVLRLIGMKVRDHPDRVSLQFAGLKRPIWAHIMRSSLGHFLERPIGDDEIEALITLWRLDDRTGMASIAQRTMRETFARFRQGPADAHARARVRDRTARQWLEGARLFAGRGQRLEAARYLARAIWWSPATVRQFIARSPDQR